MHGTTHIILNIIVVGRKLHIYNGNFTGEGKKHTLLLTQVNGTRLFFSSHFGLFFMKFTHNIKGNVKH